MDNKAQQSPSLDKKKFSTDQIKGLERTLGFASNPDMADWGKVIITGEGGEALLSALQNYRSAFQVLKFVWEDIYGEEINS